MSDSRLKRNTYTVEEAAQLLGIGRTPAYRVARENGELGGVPVIRVGRRLVIPKPALDNVLNGTANGAGSAAPNLREVKQ